MPGTEFRYPPNWTSGEPGSRSGRFGEERNPLLAGILTPDRPALSPYTDYALLAPETQGTKKVKYRRIREQHIMRIYAKIY